MRAILYISGQLQTPKSSISNTLDLMHGMINEHGDGAFGLTVIDLDSNPHLDIITVPLMVVVDEAGIESRPIVGDFSTQKMVIAELLKLPR